MRHILLMMIAVVAVVRCSSNAEPIIEAAIRAELKKPPLEELTKADLGKVTKLKLIRKKLTDVPKGLEKLTQLKELYLVDNQLTDVKCLEKLT